MRLTKQSPGDSLPRVAIASTQTAATLLALGSPGLTVVMPGKEAIALAPLSVSVLDQFEKLSDSAPRATCRSSQARRAPQASGPAAAGWHHPRTTHQASRGKAASPRKSAARNSDQVGHPHARRADGVVGPRDSRTSRRARRVRGNRSRAGSMRGRWCRGSTRSRSKPRSSSSGRSKGSSRCRSCWRGCSSRWPSASSAPTAARR